MSDQERLLRVDEDGEYYRRESEESWEEPIDEERGTSQSGWKTVLVVTTVAVLCMLSLGYILSDWAQYVPSPARVSTEVAEVAPVEAPEMGMPMDDIPIPVPTPSPESTTAAVMPTTTVAPSATPTMTNAQDKYLLPRDWDFDAAPTRREYHWTIAEKEFNPDGVYRNMILINEEYPGPLIEVNEGDTIVVHIDNQATNASAIHFHGMYQNGTNHMDGTVSITQCPIAPGGQFIYEFKVDGQSGTYWYHGHQGVQHSDGLYGPLVIHSRDERQLQQLEYDTDRVVMLSDHYWDLSSELLTTYLASDAENAEPVPEGALINGRGIRDCSKISGRRCDNSTANVGPRPLDLEHGKGHRLRIINTGAFAEFQMSIDEHEFAVTEVDGTDVVPEFIHRMVIQPAQRYSIVLNSNTAPGESFWLRAKMLTHCFAEKNPYTEAEIFAPVRWQTLGEINTAMPMSKDFPEAITVVCKDLDTTKLKPVVPMIAPPPDYSFYMRVNFEIGAWRLSRGKFNQSTWVGDVQHPTLFTAVDGYNEHNASFVMRSEDEDLPAAFINDQAFDMSTQMTLQTEGIQVIDMLFHNFDDGSHPLHLHGYKFFVMAQGHAYPPTDLLETVDTSNPLRRDTATVEAYGWTLIRLIADNPGAWAFHCHVSWHTEAGLMMQFLTRADALAKIEIPEANRALCYAPQSELMKGMTPEKEWFYGSDDD